MAGARTYRNPIYAADIRELGGCASVVTDRDRCEGGTIYRVSYISGGGDIAFTSTPICDPDQAAAAARVFAEFVRAKVLGDVSRETSASDLTGAA